MDQQLTIKEQNATRLFKGEHVWGVGQNKINITDMSDGHIKNSMKFLKSNITKFRGKHGDAAKKNKDKHGIAEANRIWKLPDKEFLCEFTEYGLLAKELHKRHSN